MKTPTKIGFAVAAIAVLGVGAYYGMQQASLSLAKDYDKAYRAVFSSLPPLIKPDSAEPWAAATRKALAEVDGEGLSRQLRLWVAAPGSRAALNEIDGALARMLELRRDQLAAVEQRLDADRAGTEEPWIQKLPDELQAQVREANRTIAWLKADAGRHAELQPLMAEFEAKSQRMQRLIAGHGEPAAVKPNAADGGVHREPAATPAPATPPAERSGPPTAPAAAPVSQATIKMVYYMR